MTKGQMTEEAYLTDKVPPPIQLFLTWLSVLTLLCAGVELVCKWIIHLQYPYTWPLMPLGNPFWDFSLYRARFDYFHSSKFFTFDGPGYFYPAPLSAVHWLLYHLPASTYAFLAMLSAAWISAAILLTVLLLRRGVTRGNAVLIVGISALCSYPFFFEFEQANLEWILCVLVGSGIVAVLQGRGYAAATCFGIAGSMKYYPLILVGLLIARKQYKQAALAVAVSAACTLVALWMLCPNLATSWHGTQIGLASFRRWYVLAYEQVGFDHSLIGSAKALSLVVRPDELPPQILSLLVGIYMPVAAFVGVILYFDRIIKLPIINQVLCLVIATILLPPVSYDYTLLHLYLPWSMLLIMAFESRDRTAPGLKAAMVCCAIIFAPVSDLIIHGQSYGGQIKSCALVALGLIALMRKFPSSFDVNTSDAGVGNLTSPSSS